MLSNEEGNQLIKEYIKTNKVFTVGRVGSPEILSTDMYDQGVQIPQHISNLLKNNAGVYGNNIQGFCREYLNAIKSSDIQIVWPMFNIKPAQDRLFSKYCFNAMKSDNRCVEPFYFDDPWSYELRGKKVLVINPFSESINKQYKNREQIWENGKILPEFELITYKNIQSIGDNGPHNSWLESLEFMKNEISDIDFDIALLGCGGYGMPLASFIKNELGKPSIYIGGGLQILFGIKGDRWDNHEDVGKLYNSYWVRPLESEKPIAANSVEGGCYW